MIGQWCEESLRGKRCTTWFFEVFVPFAFVIISTKLVSSRNFTTKFSGKWWRIWRWFFSSETPNWKTVQESMRQSFLGNEKLGDGFKYVLCSPRSLWRWSNLTFAYFPNGLLQPPNLTTRFLKICFVENFILLAPSFSGSKFGIQKFTKRPGSLFCASMGDFVVFPAMGKAHQLHFSGFKNPYPPAKGCCKGNIQPKTKYRFSMQIELVPTSSTRSCTARAVCDQLHCLSRSLGVYKEFGMMMMMMMMWAMKKDNCKTSWFKLVDIQ